MANAWLPLPSGRNPRVCPEASAGGYLPVVLNLRAMRYGEEFEWQSRVQRTSKDKCNLTDSLRKTRWGELDE